MSNNDNNANNKIQLPLPIVDYKKSIVRYIPKFLPDPISCFNGLLPLFTESEESRTIMFGKESISKRKSISFSDPEIGEYVYKGTAGRIPKDINTAPFVKYIRDYIEYHFGIHFNFCFINFYNSSDAYISYHRDNEKVIDQNYPIYSISLGVERYFYIRDIEDKKKKWEILLESGSLCTMEGECQTFLEHSVPKRKCSDGIRINLTFRVNKK